MSEALFVSVKEACRLTGLSRTTIYSLLAEQVLASTRCGRRRLIVRSSIADLVPSAAPTIELGAASDSP